MRLQPLPGHIRLPSDAELRRIKNQHRIKRPSECSTCGGSGKFLNWNSDKVEVVEWECDCDEQYILSLYFASRGISRRDATLTWSDLTDLPQAGVEWRDLYLANLQAFVDRGFGALLIGDSGTGKTLLANLMLRTAMLLGFDGYFIRYSSLLDWIPRTWDDEDERGWFEKRVTNANLLVIDDLGSSAGDVERSSPEFAMRAVDTLFRHRLSAGLPTIITSRLSVDKLHSIFGQSISDLISEASSTHVLRGPSYRHTAGDPVIEDLKLGISRPVVFG